MSISQGEAAKTRILDAAEDLMAKYGYAGTSMSQLRQATSLSASSIYWHFQNKEGVMAAMLERGITRYLDAAEAVASQPFANPLDALETLFQEIQERPQALRLAIILGMEEGADGGVGGALVGYVRKRGRELIQRIVADHLGKAIDDPEVTMLGAFVVSALDGAVILERIDGNPLTDVLSPLIELLKQKTNGLSIAAKQS